MTLEQRDIDCVLHPHTNLRLHSQRGPLIIERGEGVYLFDRQGRRFLDGLSGLWCAPFGFTRPELIEVAVRQMTKLPFCHLAAHRSTEPVIKLAERLLAIAPGRYSKVFFVNSGSEANDTQVKMLWAYNNVLGRPKKKKIIARRGGYHGGTVLGASLTGIQVFHDGYDLPVPQVRHVSAPNYYRSAYPGETGLDYARRLARELEALIVAEGPETVAAFIAEPLMAAGGVILPPEGYFSAVQAVLRKYDVRFIADEVVCGFGRTGAMWGCGTFGIEAPDSVTCAKGLAAGFFPIGAVLIDEEMCDALVAHSDEFGQLAHGFTFGGHPTGAALAIRTLELMDELRLLPHVSLVAEVFISRVMSLAQHPLVGEARGVGLIAGLELVANKATKACFKPGGKVGQYCAARCEDNGLIVRALGDTIALCPPLVASEDELNAMLSALEVSLDETWREICAT